MKLTCKSSCFIAFGLFLLTIFGCKSTSRLERALSIAGENRIELEKVISHYSIDPADSLKLRSAIFLIENMPGHYSYDDDCIYEYYARADSILKIDIPFSEKRSKLENLAENYPNLGTETRLDITFITADFLIYNIEKAFEAWKIKPWASQLTFNQFCEFLLPYKVTELQEFDNWRDTLGAKYTKIFNESVQYIDETRNSTFDASHTLTTELKNAVNVDLVPIGQKCSAIPLLEASNIDKIVYGYCEDYTVVTTAVMRAHGVPMVMDFVPKWGRMMAGHGWCVILNTHGDELPFDGVTGDWPGAWFGPTVQSKPKVFRHTYAINRRVEKYRQKAKYIYPPVDHVFRSDVTNHYIATANLRIPIDRAVKPADHYAYLAVYDYNVGWRILDFGEIKKRTAHIENVGKDIVYLIYVFDGRRLVPAANPVIAKIDGDIVPLNPDSVNTRSVALTRKYYRTHHVAFMERRLIGGRIEASNRKDFRNAEVMHRIDSIWTSYKIPVNKEKKAYRYWRYSGPDGAFCNIAELMFWPENDTVPLYGKIIGTDGAFNNDSTHMKNAAFDREALTSFDAPHPDGCWVGMDFGKPVCIDRITCIPRSDDNAVYPGQEYELMYWGAGNWQSLGKQTAADKVLYYDNVPDNALLLLRNHSRGKQERIFTYENDKQIWW